ncbi:MAG: glycosyltransferase [Fibromonadaceae bacterium]|jgi:alpha-1,6-mannosyltransferase|nr:glycosyltransferase [Fibromonadaceae bacterium]
MINVLDINNFWSPSGGGVRRYHLEKMDYYSKKQSDFKLIFLMQDDCNRTEEISPTLTIEHVKAFKIPGKWWKYRFIFNPKQIRKYIEKYKPDIIEVGSPYVLPAAVRKACEMHFAKTDSYPSLLGFWHADFPVTYIRRPFNLINGFLAKKLENIAWAYARHGFKNYRGIQVSCKEVMQRMESRGLSNLEWIPLGVDIEKFAPSKKDGALAAELKAGEANRLTMFFPHRSTEEKGLNLLLKAYPVICEKLGLEPALVFAGTGNKIHLVREAVKKYRHIKYAGFIKNVEEMARWNASCEIGFALSGWETFGLSILEGMASGQCLVGANTGAAAEHIRESGGGIILQNRDEHSLAQAICEIAEDREKMQIMGKKGRAYAERFSWDLCFERQGRYYEAICKSVTCQSPE